MNKIISFFRLARLDKPIGILLLLWPTMSALWLASNGFPDANILVAFIFGVVVMRSAGCVINDLADADIDKNVEMKAINRQIKLISEIDKALRRIREDTYGYCLDTAEPIGLKRLMARPVAKYTIAAQEKHEKEEKVHADD